VSEAEDQQEARALRRVGLVRKLCTDKIARCSELLAKRNDGNYLHGKIDAFKEVLAVLRK
jgi:hypothetical protein